MWIDCLFSLSFFLSPLCLILNKKTSIYLEMYLYQTIKGACMLTIPSWLPKLHQTLTGFRYAKCFSFFFYLSLFTFLCSVSRLLFVFLKVRYWIVSTYRVRVCLYINISSIFPVREANVCFQTNQNKLSAGSKMSSWLSNWSITEGTKMNYSKRPPNIHHLHLNLDLLFSPRHESSFLPVWLFGLTRFVSVFFVFSDFI